MGNKTKGNNMMDLYYWQHLDSHIHECSQEGNKYSFIGHQMDIDGVRSRINNLPNHEHNDADYWQKIGNKALDNIENFLKTKNKQLSVEAHLSMTALWHIYNVYDDFEQNTG